MREQAADLFYISVVRLNNSSEYHEMIIFGSYKSFQVSNSPDRIRARANGVIVGERRAGQIRATEVSRDSVASLSAIKSSFPVLPYFGPGVLLRIS